MSISRADLMKGPQPTSLEEYIGVAIGAATTIPYGPGVAEPFDEVSANAIRGWAVDGIRSLEARV